MSKEFQAYLTLKGIEHQLTVSHSPQQNGVAERLHCTRMESARAIHCTLYMLPNTFQVEAVMTAAYLRNCTTTLANKEKPTPIKKWYDQNSSLGVLIQSCSQYRNEKA